MPYRRNIRRAHMMRGRAGIKLCLAAAVLAAALLYAAFNIALVPVLKTSAVNRARIVAIDTINNAAGRVLKNDSITYDRLMRVDKDSSGSVTAVSADTMQINMLKYDVTGEVIRELNSIDPSELAIPFGTVIGGQLFTGRGPYIRIKIQPIGSVDSNIVNSFSSAGINQTRQQIMLDVKADITLIIASYNVSTRVESNIDVADIVIVGGVPGSYTYVGGSGGAAGSDGRVIIYGGGAASSAPAKNGK